MYNSLKQHKYNKKFENLKYKFLRTAEIYQMAADSSTGFCAPPNGFLAGKFCDQTDSGAEIGGLDGPQIPAPELVWGAESPKRHRSGDALDSCCV